MVKIFQLQTDPGRWGGGGEDLVSSYWSCKSSNIEDNWRHHSSSQHWKPRVAWLCCTFCFCFRRNLKSKKDLYISVEDWHYWPVHHHKEYLIFLCIMKLCVCLKTTFHYYSIYPISSKASRSIYPNYPLIKCSEKQ